MPGQKNPLAFISIMVGTVPAPEQVRGSNVEGGAWGCSVAVGRISPALVHPGWRQGRVVVLGQRPGFRQPCEPRRRCSLPCLSGELATVQIHRRVTEVLAGSVQVQVGGEEVSGTRRMPVEVEAESQPCRETPSAALLPVQGEDLDLLGSVCVRGGSACPPEWQRGGGVNVGED